MKLNANYVLVRRMGDPASMEGLGLRLIAEEDHFYQSCFGEIIAVCDELRYFGYDIGELSAKPKGNNLKMMTRLGRHSLQFDVPMEVEVGDKVVFSHLVNISPERQVSDSEVLVRYDELLLKWAGGEDVYPLNGHLLLQLDNQVDMAGPLRLGSERSRTEGLVVAQGALVRHYLDWPKERGDYPTPDIVGKMAICMPDFAVRIEDDFMRVLPKWGDNPLYYIHRKFVLFYADKQDAVRPS